MPIVRAPRPCPAFCKAGSDHPSAKLFPLATSGREFSVYDPKTQKFALVDTCFSTMHLQFGFDPDDTLWSSAPNTQVLGWIDTKTLEETGDAAKAQGWTPFIVDTIGSGKRDATTRYTEPGKPIEPGKDARIGVGLYGVSPEPKDGVRCPAQGLCDGWAAGTPFATEHGEDLRLPVSFWGCEAPARAHIEALAARAARRSDRAVHQADEFSALQGLGRDGDEMPIFNPSRLLTLRPSGSLKRIRCNLLDPCLEATC